ncbi:MAG: ribosomal L7Ae/L30e/S12e/Gadd45 family protein [Oscillospiraceae bacterium]|nr:ribosomal L7Ae/L30e/S12e/Gadd45 family protein [Oscillospiraceae bacterium]
MSAELAKWLNLCRKAGALPVGAAAARASLKSGKALLTVTASDAGAAIVREMETLSRDRGVPLLRAGIRKKELGVLTGRGATAVMVVTNSELALKIQEILKS